MARPCPHTSIDPACPVCRFYRNSPRHRAAWDAALPALLAPATPDTPTARTRCDSLGEPISGATAARLGLSVLRAWHPCAQGHGEKGHVCACDAAAVCGACGDWTTAED